MRYLGLVLIFILSGCTLKTLPPLNYYSLKENITVQEIKNSPYKNRILKVAIPLSFSNPLDYKLYFNYLDGQRGAYQNSQWQTPLYKQLQKFFIVTLQKAHIFKSVVSTDSTVYEDLRLESTVYALENRIINKKSYAVLDIELRLVDMKDRSIIKQKRFTYQKSAPTFNAKGYIVALNSILEQLANDMVRWLAK
jgi:ABC-type uncharacterized transport system auxiliary subunit